MVDASNTKGVMRPPIQSRSFTRCRASTGDLPFLTLLLLLQIVGTGLIVSFIILLLLLLRFLLFPLLVLLLVIIMVVGILVLADTATPGI